MEAPLKLFPALLVLLCITIGGGAAVCNTSAITIEQARTGSIVEGKPEYQVMVSNNCECAQSKVMVQCYGISSVEPVDSRAIRPVDDERCLLRGGRPIIRGSPLKFRYAWLTPQDFPVVSSQIHCK